jgi:hypothetical protein
MRRGLTAVVAAAALASASPAALHRSGLYGVVRKGPITPVCQAGTPCDGPARVTLFFWRSAKQVARVRSASATGSYRIGLAPGYYTVTTDEKIGVDRKIRPRTAHVRLDHWDKLNFFIDTGIR